MGWPLRTLLEISPKNFICLFDRSLDEAYSRCRIILAETYGNRYIGNDSSEFYDGAIGQIQSAKADILLRAGHYFINPAIIGMSRWTSGTLPGTSLEKR